MAGADMIGEGIGLLKRGVRGLVGGAAEVASDAASEVRELWAESIEDVRGQLPAFDEVLSQAALVPGVRVDRATYLQEVLAREPESVRNKAVAASPARAGITQRELARISRRQMKRETRHTTVISFAAGVPGGAAAAATIPADLVQFYAHLLRAIQMLSYLYGWQDICLVGDGEMEADTRCALVLFLGVMAGDETADKVLRSLSKRRDVIDPHKLFSGAAVVSAAEGVGERLAARMAKRMTGQVVGKAVPIAGAVISGRISHSGFSDMTKRLCEKLDSWW